MNPDMTCNEAGDLGGGSEMNPGIWSKEAQQWRGERGAALVVALMVMVICALLGAASIMTSNTDMQIGMNEKVYHEALMNGDAGVQWVRGQYSVNMLNMLENLVDVNNNLSSVQSTTGIRFRISGIPSGNSSDEYIAVWCEPTTDFPVYRFRSVGNDRNDRGGQVTIEAGIRPAGTRPCKDIFEYAGSN